MIDFNKIESIRIKRGFTKKSFASKLGMARPTYDGLLDGNDLKVSTFVKICEVLNISPWEVWKGEKSEINELEQVNEGKPVYTNMDQERISILMDSLQTKNELIERLKAENEDLKAKLSGAKTKQAARS